MGDWRGGRRAGEQVAQRRHRGLGAGQVLLEGRQVRGDELGALVQVWSLSTARIWSSGMPRSRKRRMTWAVGIWLAVYCRYPLSASTSADARSPTRW
jgi:hypothetical protein